MNNPQEKEVHVLYKKLGETPLECVERYRSDKLELAGTPLTYAGRLDPLAEGVLIALSGEGVAQKSDFLKLSKTYECKILWGFHTDSLDILGVVSLQRHTPLPSSEDVEKIIQKSVGIFHQKYPHYSSRTVGGKSLIEWSRLGRIGEIEIPSHEVEILKAEYVSRIQINGEELQKEIIRRVGLVSGDFRQKEIKNKWRKAFSQDVKTTYTIDTVRLEVSSGFYVRQFVADLAHTLETQATTFHILRTQVGKYKVKK